ncbi:MAG: hypothetical protein IKB67_04615, partial [Clostridia bacterium]|nr:hypothetical protein [Clostridia bacterium]
VIFLPCDFVACGVYLFFINFLTKGNWFLTFALPVLAGVMLITCVLLVLLKYLKKGKLYVVGGSIIGIGGLFVLIENLMVLTFDIAFTGWSYYPLISLALIGGLLIYLAINSVARAKIERKIFF